MEPSVDIEPPLTDHEIRMTRELLQAKATSKALVLVVKSIAIWFAAVAAGVAAFKYLVLDFIGKGH